MLIIELELAYGKYYDKKYGVTSGLKHKTHSTANSQSFIPWSDIINSDQEMRLKPCWIHPHEPISSQRPQLNSNLQKP